MATQTVDNLPAPDAQVVGNAFVEQYYHLLHQSPELVHRFYHDTSVFSRPDPNGVIITVTTMKSINDQICSLDYNDYKSEIKTADAQDSYMDGVIVLVTGCLTGKDNLKRKFTQTFFLAPQDKGYYVKNDVFRYVEDNEPDIIAVIGVNDTPSSSLVKAPESVQVVENPYPNDVNSREEIEIIEEKENDNKIQIRDDRDIVIESKSHADNSSEFVMAELDSSAIQDGAPKKSYASIVSSQTKKGPTKVYVPTNTARINTVKFEKQTTNPAVEVLKSETSAPSPPADVALSQDARDEVEGHSIYIRNLPLNATAAQIEAEFSKFGAIKHDGVQVRSNKLQGFCFGFVEFQDLSSMQTAIKASPVIVGGYPVVVEIKRTTTRVGSGRGRFPSSRGGYRNNDSFRGRGNFSGGRNFVRSDSFRGRGNFYSGRGGEGYQQGRGRGGRSNGPMNVSASS